MNPRTSYLSSHYFFSISTDQWMPVLVNLTAMDRTLPRHLTPPERFLPICPDATRDEESSPEATRSVPLRVPARRDPCRHPAVYRKRPSLLEGWILLLIPKSNTSINELHPSLYSSCDIPRTPHRRAPEIPPHGSGSRTAPRTNTNTTSSLGSSVVGIGKCVAKAY